MGDGLEVESHVLLALPFLLTVLLWKPVQGASQAKEPEEQHRWCLLARLRLTLYLKLILYYL